MALRRPRLRICILIPAVGVLLAILIDFLVMKRQFISGGWTGPGDFHIFRGGACAIFVCWQVWSLHRENKVTVEYRLALAACLVFLVTHFAYTSRPGF